MRRILILDTETTGLDPKVDSTIEVGCILYSVEHAAPLEYFASLIHAETNAAESVNRISVDMLRDAPQGDDVWPRLFKLAARADAIVAHNATFDRGFVPAMFRDLRPWICSKDDLRWPKQTKEGASLVSLILEHDLGICMAHRALADCDMLARLFTRAAELGADLSAMLERGMRPKAEFAALVSYDDRALASTAGFRWNQPGREKQWTRTMAIEDAAALPFQTRRLS